MRKLKVGKIWILAFLLVIAMAGCGDPDVGGGPTSPTTAPTVVTTFPTGAATGVCQAVLVTATFSKPMDPATINTGTFTLAAGSTPVAGTVSIDSADLVATFTPTNPLAVNNTQYTATITTGARDQFGNALATNFQWMFTTNATLCPGPFGLPGCGTGILAGSTVTNTSIPGPTNTNVTGDVDVWPGTAITGFPPGTITAPHTTHSADAVAKAAQDQLTLAYNAAAGAPGGAAIPGMIGGPGTAPFPPGVYKATSTLLIVGDITLDGSTNPNGTWIFQVGTALTTQAGAPGLPGSQVLLVNATPKQVFWQLGSSGTIGTYALFQGTIMANQSITLGTGATLNGRALAEVAAVTLDSNKVNVPPCP